MRNHFKTFILLGTLSAIFIAVGGIQGKSYLLSFTVLALIFSFAAYWFSDRLVLALHRVREISPQENFALHNMVEDLARRANIPKPRLYPLTDQTSERNGGSEVAFQLCGVTAGRLHGKRIWPRSCMQ